MKLVHMFQLGVCILLMSSQLLAENVQHYRYDLTLVGQIKWRASLARLPISVANLFKNDLSINIIRTRGKLDLQDVPEDVQEILKNPDKTPGRVALFFDVLWSPNTVHADHVPQESLVKIAYSELEGTAIPDQWVEALNKQFDLVAVPDEFYKIVYQECGVKIPIFVLPHGIDIEELLLEPVKRHPSSPFVFGLSAMYIPRKNHMRVIEAFQEEFGNDSSVRLKIHGRWGEEYEVIEKKLHAQKTRNLATNIEVIKAQLDNEQYNDFLKSLDCYVLLSKGEGFSITPREALALGKPCIISNNTAHCTLAKTDYVYAVPAEIKEPALYPVLGGCYGYNFNCTIEDARSALREVYNNFERYVEKAENGRKWVEQYLWKNVKAKFLNLIKPKKVILGEENLVTDDYVMTSSVDLYYKYLNIIDQDALEPQKS